MAPNRKASQGTIRRPRRGKAVVKATAVKGRVEGRAGAAVKARSEKPKKDGKPSGPVAKAVAKPVKSKDGLLTETSIKSGTLKATVAKPAGASAPVKPVKVGGKIDAQGIPAGKLTKPQPRASGGAVATAVPASPPQLESKTEKGAVAKPEAAATSLLSAQQPAAVVAAADDVMPPAKAPMETRLRYIKRYVDLAGPDMVPLSRKVSQVVWAFDVVDAFTGTSAGGKTHIFAVLKGQEAEKEYIELATFSTRSGRLVVQTLATLKKEEPFEPLTSLVSVVGGTLNKDDVVKLRFKNDRYVPTTIAQDESKKFEKLNLVELSPAPSYPFPSAHDPDGSMAFILGLAPESFKADSIARMTEPLLPGAGGTSLIDAQRRFALWGPADKVLAKEIAGDKPSFKVQFEISDAPGDSPKLKLTYRATREKFDNNSGPIDGASNTDRMKLIALEPSESIEAKAVPPVYLLLQ